MSHDFTESSFLSAGVMCAIESVNKKALLEQVEMKKFLWLRSKNVTLHRKTYKVDWHYIKWLKKEKHAYITSIYHFKNDVC